MSSEKCSTKCLTIPFFRVNHWHIDHRSSPIESHDLSKIIPGYLIPSILKFRASGPGSERSETSHLVHNTVINKVQV
jgi:hypothetical protein